MKKIENPVSKESGNQFLTWVAVVAGLLIFTLVFINFALAADKDEKKGREEIVLAMERVVYLPSSLDEQEYTVLAEDGEVGGDGTADFYEIRLIFPQFGGCFVVLDGNTENPVYLQEAELPELFWEVGKKEEYGGQTLLSDNPVFQEILAALELVD